MGGQAGKQVSKWQASRAGRAGGALRRWAGEQEGRQMGSKWAGKWAGKRAGGAGG